MALRTRIRRSYQSSPSASFCCEGVRRSRDSWNQRPARSLHNLLAALNQARHFVHFISTGLSWDFIGMLALLSHRVAVRGVISMDEGPKARQLLKVARVRLKGI